jgi:hypothetical protein
MRLLRNLVVLVILCLILGAPAASAAEGPAVPAGREVGELARIVFGHFQAFLKAVWENEAGEIDPWGRTSPGAGGDSGDEPTPGADIGFEIDPWG